MGSGASSKRRFIPIDLDLNNWNDIEPYYKKLLGRLRESSVDLGAWMKDYDELNDALQEFATLSYIRYTTHTDDPEAQKSYAHITGQVITPSTTYDNEFHKLLVKNPALEGLSPPDFLPSIERMKKEMQLYSEQNLPLLNREQLLAGEYNQVKGGQTIRYGNEDLTIDKAALLLKGSDRSVREEVFKKICERRFQDADRLDNILTELVQLRHEIAQNAGFKSYIDYSFNKWGRTDYTPADCAAFHPVVAEMVVPVDAKLMRYRKKYLQVDMLRPWDVPVELTGRSILKPSTDTNDLIEKTIACLTRLDPHFGKCLQLIRDMNHLDLESRPGKIKGVGYHATLAETGVPYIVQNNNNSERDRLVLIHETGHAIHSLLASTIEYSILRLKPPLEIAEVASKGLELLSMKYWDTYYTDPADVKTAKKIKLASIISYLPLYSLGDSFEAWLYENPTHTKAQRKEKWLQLTRTYGSGVVDYSGYEETRCIDYQEIPPVYILPFYLTAYSFSDLGSISIWRNFMHNPETTLSRYKAALSLGTKRSVPELYKTAGIEFNFSRPYVKELMDFVEQQMEEL